MAGFAADCGELFEDVNNELASELVSATWCSELSDSPSFARSLKEEATPSKSSTRVNRRTTDGAAGLLGRPGAEPPPSEVDRDVIEVVSGVPELGVEAAIANSEEGGGTEQGGSWGGHQPLRLITCEWPSTPAPKRRGTRTTRSGRSKADDPPNGPPSLPRPDLNAQPA